MPDHPAPGEADPSPADGEAWRLLATPVITDHEVLDRVTAVIGPAISDSRTRTLWLLFLDANGTQENFIVPVDDVPELPAAPAIGMICCITSEALARRSPGGSAVITLSRPGTTTLTPSDHYLLRALQHEASAYRTRVRMLCLATPDGVRELGPASPTAGSQASQPEPDPAPPRPQPHDVTLSLDDPNRPLPATITAAGTSASEAIARAAVTFALTQRLTAGDARIVRVEGVTRDGQDLELT